MSLSRRVALGRIETRLTERRIHHDREGETVQSRRITEEIKVIRDLMWECERGDR